MRTALLGFVFALATAAASPGSANAATTPVGDISLAVIGLLDPAGKVPAVNAIPGSDVPNISVAFPSVALNHGEKEVVSIGSQDLAYSGTCVTSYTLKATVGAEQKIIATGATAGYQCVAGNAFIYAFRTGALPNDPGPATLIAKVSFGSTAISETVSLTIK